MGAGASSAEWSGLGGMKRLLQASQRSGWCRPTRRVEVHSSVGLCGRCPGLIGTGAMASRVARGVIRGPEAREVGAPEALGPGWRHLALACGAAWTDTLHHASERGASRVREGDFVQRRII